MPVYFFTEYKTEIFKKLHGWKIISKFHKIILIILSSLLLANLGLCFCELPTTNFIQLGIQIIILIICIILAIREDGVFTKSVPNRIKIYKESFEKLIRQLQKDDYNFYTKEKIMWLIENYNEKLTELKQKNSQSILATYITPVVLIFLGYCIENDLSSFIYFLTIFSLILFLCIFVRSMIQLFMTLGDTLIYKRLKEQLEYLLLNTNFSEEEQPTK
ncbi:MAG: hypothetical protein R3Y36_02560 [Spirochaetales bacterium]